jgi:peptidoglycan/xylan/chitin deacetylase (PgdA/CDA1 family)
MTTGKPTPDKPVSRLLFVLAAIMLITCTMGIARGETISPPAIPMVSFVFDDGNDTDYLVGRELFAAHGAVASSAVTTGFINTVDHMTPDQILELQRAGWEIMGHTVTHPNLRSLSPEAVDAELSQSKAELERLGVTVTNMVYPYNKNDDTVREVASRYYRSGRGGTNAFNAAGVDPYYLKSFALKHDVERMKGLIDTAVREGKWLVIYQHEIDAKVKVSDYDGSFRKGETVRLSPSGAIARFTTTHWFPLYGYALYLVPLSGTPRPGDTVSGMSSGARATIDRIVYNEREQLGDMLSYLRNSHPTVPVVTIDKGLDLLGVPRFQGGKHAQR